MVTPKEAFGDIDLLCQWLEENSSGVYRPCMRAVKVIRDLQRDKRCLERDNRYLVKMMTEQIDTPL